MMSSVGLRWCQYHRLEALVALALLLVSFEALTNERRSSVVVAAAFRIAPTTPSTRNAGWSFSRLQSLNHLIADVDSITATSTRSSAAATATATATATAASSKAPQRKQPLTLFVGGKGGVGKTTVSSALAVQLQMASCRSTDATAADSDSATDAVVPLRRVLIVSTDPAHSLGDALDVDLKSGQRVYLNDYTTALSLLCQHSHSEAADADVVVVVGHLYAQEIDASAALAEFQATLAAFDVPQLAQSLGVSPALLESFGLADFVSVLENPPPGLDELVALSNIFSTDNDDEDGEAAFDVIVVDTAPTGHTLRLLALPQFLDGVLTKLVKLRSKLTMLTSTLSSFLGGSSSSSSSSSSSTNDDTVTSQERTRAMETAVAKLEQFQAKMVRLRTSLQTKETTRFIIVTVPTILGVAETKRLALELQRQSIAVSDIVVNQCILEESSSSSSSSSSSGLNRIEYYNRRVTQQQKWMEQLRTAVQKVSDSPEYQQNTGGGLGELDASASASDQSTSISLTSVPFWDVELVSVPALGYVGSQVYVDNPDFAHLLGGGSNNVNGEPPKVVICGGKGGVGKTTTSASLAIAMAAVGGHKVALISTDPAHSLGDAIAMDLSGGTLFECSLAGVPGYTGDGSLSALEIDPTAALQQFKGLVDQLVGGGAMKNAGSSPDANQGFRDTLKDLQEVFDTLPAGTDEVVALAKIVNLVKKGGFDRIVLDTAPTGHTLRMLSTPGFLADFIERLLRISDKINANPIVKLFIATSSRREEINTAIETSKSTLLSFQFQMYDLEDLFANAQQTEFLIVTVPTELAVRESVRLLNDLTFEAPDMPIKVRNVVVNQVLRNDDDNDAVTFLSHLERTQRASIEDLERFTASLATNDGDTNSIGLTKVPYLDSEPRGVYGLKALAAELTKVDTKSDSAKSMA